jgi:hypothetical protein
VKYLVGFDHPNAKERNSGVIMDELWFEVQVQIICPRPQLFSAPYALVRAMPKSQASTGEVTKGNYDLRIPLSAA